MSPFYRLAFSLLVSRAVALTAHAQPFKNDAKEQGLKGGVHWVKRTWYNPKPGTTEPDKSKLPSLYLRPNQLIEYTKDGKLRGVMDYEAGTDDVPGPAETWTYSDGRIVKHAQENANYEAVYTTTHTYDAAGHEIKRETVPGPGDKTGFVQRELIESSWNGTTQKEMRRDRNGNVLLETTYTTDASGNIIRETYAPVGLYSAHTYDYDSKGSLVKETYLDKSGQPSTIWIFENNAAGKPTKRIMKHFYQGKQDGEETTIYSYNTQGELTAQKTVKDGKTTYDYAWQHTYDAKGNRIQTVHIKEGKPEAIEVLDLRYY